MKRKRQRLAGDWGVLVMQLKCHLLASASMEWLIVTPPLLFLLPWKRTDHDMSKTLSCGHALLFKATNAESEDSVSVINECLSAGASCQPGCTSGARRCGADTSAGGRTQHGGWPSSAGRARLAHQVT